MPIRKRPINPDEHIKILRWSITFVAFFAYFFSLYYPPNMPIFLFCAATGTIWLGGSGAVIIGGLYWKRGTTAGAYCALYSGAVLGFLSVVSNNIWQHFYHKDFFMNPQWVWFIAMMVAITAYYAVSVVSGKGKEPANLNKLLHRGQYSREVAPIMDEYRGSILLKIAGITKEFSKGDRFLTVFLVTWNLLNFLWFIAFSIVNLLRPVSDQAWTTYWHANLLICAVLAFPSTVWFTIGGVIDIKALLKHLDTAVRDHTDDGRVIHEPEVVKTQSIAQLEVALDQLRDGVTADE